MSFAVHSNCSNSPLRPTASHRPMQPFRGHLSQVHPSPQGNANGFSRAHRGHVSAGATQVRRWVYVVACPAVPGLIRPAG